MRECICGIVLSTFLYNNHSKINWGDFNTTLNEKEKIEGLQVTSQQCEDFSWFINLSGLFDVGFKGNSFIWWNDKIDDESIYEKLVSMQTFNQLMVHRDRISGQNRI